MAPGDKLGHFEILSCIGAGGMGEVWKARDTRLGRTVAIKTLRGRHNSRFEQEARAIAKLNHPHVCQIYDVGPDYLVLEYVDGEPIKGPLGTEEAARIALQVVSALEEAHNQGILHRDLKPGNILMTSKGAKLLDFGLAKLMDDADATQTMGTAGTPLYMSPEQAEARTLDARSDVFSFGAVLYELLAGRRAFDSLASVLRDPPAPLQSPLASVVLRCLAKAPAERFQNAAQLRAALEKPREASSPDIDSIAVLPFANQSNDPDPEYLCEGITESIINSLAAIKGLRVVPRGTAFRFKDHQDDAQAVGRELGVRTVLTGRVNQRGENLVVSTELLDVAAGRQLWGERFHRRLADIFALEEDIARKISDSLRGRLTGAQTELLVRRSTQDTEAYQLYLRGRQQWGLRTGDHLRHGVKYFQQAIEKDPAFADAYAGMADCYSILACYYLEPPKGAWSRAKAAAVAAIAFDPKLAAAHASLGFIRAYSDYDWTGGEIAFQESIRLNPDYLPTRYWYALILTSMGRFEDAETQIARGMELEPLSPLICHEAAFNAIGAGQFELAIERCRKGLEGNPHFHLIHYWHGVSLNALGRYQEAVAALEHATVLSGRTSWAAATLGVTLMQCGKREAAERILQELSDGWEDGTVDPTSLAAIHLGLGDVDAAFAWLERGLETKGMLPVFMKPHPLFLPLRSHPRFQGVLQKLNLA